MQAEPDRQIAAFVRSCQTLAAIGFPLCILQAVLARPVVIAFFGERWGPSISLLQVLSIGMAVAMVNFTSTLMQAQGRFRTLAIWTIATTLGFIACVIVGTRSAHAEGAAAAVCLFHIVTGFIGMRLAIGKNSGWSAVARIFNGPAAASLVATIPVAAVFRAWPDSYTGLSSVTETAAATILCGLIFCVVYAIAMRYVARDVSLDILNRIRRIAF
jgi:O-antigen/teichoic acid export membrane protein